MRARYVLLGCLAMGCDPTLPDVPTAVATRGPFEVTLSVAGELKATTSLSVFTPALRVDSIKVVDIIEEGSVVQKGDLLVTFDQVSLEREVVASTSKLEVARTKIDQARARHEVKQSDARAEVVGAELGLQRAQMSLTESETVPLVEREGAKLDVIEQEMAIERAKSGLKAAQLEAQAEIQLLELEAEEAERDLRRAEEQIEKAELRAPGDGIVILTKMWKGGSRSPVTAGDTIWGGRAIIELPDLSSMQVIAWVHEVDSALVQLEQPVEVVIDAHPDPAHVGRVSKVADLAVSRNRDEGVKHLKVTIDLEESTSVMKPGMTVRSEILLDRFDDVVSVPIEAVGRRDEESWVWIQGFRGWSEQPVELGAENDTHVVVVSGLDEGTEVALVDPDKFAAGEATSAADEPSP